MIRYDKVGHRAKGSSLRLLLLRGLQARAGVENDRLRLPAIVGPSQGPKVNLRKLY